MWAYISIPKKRFYQRIFFFAVVVGITKDLELSNDRKRKKKKLENFFTF